MRNAKRFVTGWIVCGVLIVLVGLLSVSPTPVEAQSAGNNAVYTSASAIGPSASFIDASVLPSTTSTDICSRINSALGMIPSAIGSGVIDARGINSGNSSMTCAQSPWINLNPIPDSIILLPAGTITLAFGLELGAAELHQAHWRRHGRFGHEHDNDRGWIQLQRRDDPDGLEQHHASASLQRRPMPGRERNLFRYLGRGSLAQWFRHSWRWHSQREFPGT